MTAQGASDSVYMQELEVPLLLFSVFLSTGGSAKQTHAFILSTISYTLLLPQSLEDCGAAADTGRPSISRTERNGTGSAHPGMRVGGLFLSVSPDDQLADQE